MIGRDPSIVLNASHNLQNTAWLGDAISVVKIVGAGRVGESQGEE